MKLNIGAGNDAREGWMNHDGADLPGIDMVHDLNIYPWPWKSNSIDEILILDVLEHLNDFVKAMEELHRILKVGGRVTIRVPYWNHSCAYIDPTHKRGFHEHTFHFFDVNSHYYKERGYYSSVKFEIIEEVLRLASGAPYPIIRLLGISHVRTKFFRSIVGWFGNHIGNIISDVQVVMIKSNL